MVCFLLKVSQAAVAGPPHLSTAAIDRMHVIEWTTQAIRHSFKALSVAQCIFECTALLKQSYRCEHTFIHRIIHTPTRAWVTAGRMHVQFADERDGKQASAAARRKRVTKAHM